MIATLIDGVAHTLIARAINGYRNGHELLYWRRHARRGQAPRLVKWALLRSYAADRGLDILVETGTCLGETVYALRHDFDRIVTVELSPALHARALRRLAPLAHVSARCGDSAVLLPDILREISEPALFFLDGHYSGGVTARASKDTPIVEELSAIFADGKRHVIVIDDARLFVGKDGYPTLDDLRALARDRAPHLTVKQHSDLIALF